MQHFTQVLPCKTTPSVGLWPSSTLLEERCSIARLHEDAQSIRQIATTLDRQPSTVARALKRNTGRKIGYQPAYAQAQTQARRWTGSKLERNDTLCDSVLNRLACGWSPEQIAGRLAREVGHKVISHETIYRFVYAQLKRTNDTTSRLNLPRAKIKRGWRTKACPCILDLGFEAFCGALIPMGLGHDPNPSERIGCACPWASSSRFSAKALLSAVEGSSAPAMIVSNGCLSLELECKVEKT